jgi:HK97 family phage prohead protease
MLNKLNNPLERCNLKFNEVGGLDSVTNGLFEGYASTFGNIDSVGDTIMKGAYTETINPENRQAPIAMLANHSASFAIGKWLEMAEDDTGLYVHGELTPGHSVANNIYASMKHGAINGLSIGFRVPVGGAEEIEGGGRRISKVNLVEISVVTFPADASANISVVKSEIEEIKSVRDCELFLRDAGFSRGMAKALIGQLRPLYLREAEEERQHKQAQDAAREWLRDLIIKTRS